MRRHEKKLHFAVKYFLASAGMLCTILLLSAHFTIFQTWAPLYAMTTVNAHSHFLPCQLVFHSLPRRLKGHYNHAFCS